MRLIGLVGAKGSGKSTTARHLCERHGYARVPFAKPLKDMLRAIGLTEAQVDGDEKELPSSLLLGRTPRHAMQTLGTEWGRSCIHSEVWLNLWLHATVGHALVVVDDVRFANEAALVKSLGGTLIRIERNRDPVAESLLLSPEIAASLAHSSETEMTGIDCDAVLFNHGSIDDLFRIIDGSDAF